MTQRDSMGLRDFRLRRSKMVSTALELITIFLVMGSLNFLKLVQKFHVKVRFFTFVGKTVQRFEILLKRAVNLFHIVTIVMSQMV